LVVVRKEMLMKTLLRNALRATGSFLIDCQRTPGPARRRRDFEKLNANSVADHRLHLHRQNRRRPENLPATGCG